MTDQAPVDYLNAMYERVQDEPIAQVSLRRYLLRVSARGFRHGPSPLATRRPKPDAKPVVLKTKLKSLSRFELVSCCLDSCSICMDKHNKIDTVTTSCGHEFGKKCYASWLNAPHGNQCCPVCRNPSPSLVAYRARATRKVPTSTFEKVESK